MEDNKDSSKKSKKDRFIKILGVRVDDVSRKEAVEIAFKLAKLPNRGNYIVTVNPEFVMLAHRNAKFDQILTNSDLSVADGAGVAISKLILGGREHDRITGVDLIEKICKKSADRAIRIGFLGGFGGVAEKVAQRQSEKYPGLKVSLAKPGDPTISYNPRLKEEFDKVGRIDVLFVAYGMGKQEFWIDNFRAKLNVGLYIGVGGAFDYIAGKKTRAPKILRDFGMEWLWRLVFDPPRLWRMRVLPIFAFLVFLQFLKKNFSGKFLQN